MAQTFTTEGTVPQNWYVTNGRTKRVGGGLPYENGCRLMYFPNGGTGLYGLYVQCPAAKQKGAFARFGDEKGRSRMTLHAGEYSLLNRVYNFDQQEKVPALFCIETPDGQEIASLSVNPITIIGGNTENKFSSGKGPVFKFTIPETGEYYFTVYTDAVKNADFVLGMAKIQAKSFNTTGIQEMGRDQESSAQNRCFDMSGRRLSRENLKAGLYIIDGRKVVIK